MIFILIRLFYRASWFLLLVVLYLGWQSQSAWEDTKYKPRQAELASKQGQLDAKTAEVKKAEEFRNQREEKIRNLTRLKLEVDEQAKLVPKTATLREVLRSLADRADATGLDFVKFKPDAETRKSFLVLIPVKVSLKGTYTQIMSFLDAAANMERAVTTDTLALDAPQKTGGTAILNAEATMITYYLDEAALAASSAPPPPADPTKKGN